MRVVLDLTAAESEQLLDVVTDARDEAIHHRQRETAAELTRLTDMVADAIHRATLEDNE